ncbi:hypothetical protein [Sporanaerobacter acetigenes]|uniref:SLH domain-containing protein n=1 Tax=Sporanaerobacter acetigenes DSM 13106 TaxID=1123281 RepID=A0A1M5T1U8_9FIRM|nr:hypothetical protein [Sporanaerobacter acetigenes]SHH44707.1 hypothetical protein SAMN02745180_00349 [Sporanaerobacter acetigenes DSM 13106]
MKKSIALVLSIVLVLLTLTPALANSTQDELYNQCGEILGSSRILQGNASGDLMLEQKLKRQDMVVLVSRLFREEDKARYSKAEVPFKDVTNPFYKSYINWSMNKKLIEGKTPTKFGFNEIVTVQQLQAVLLRALDYNEEASKWGKVPDEATKLGIMNSIEAMPANKEVERGLMAVMTVNALRINKKGTNTTLAEFLNMSIPDAFTVENKVIVNRDAVQIEGIATGVKTLKLNIKPVSSNITTGEKIVDVPLDSNGRFSVEVKGLQSGNYNYRFSNGNSYTKYESFTIKELPFELSDVKGDNLKEIKLTFTKAVDKNTALFASNYYTNAGTIKKVRLEDGDRQVILTLDNNINMTNQKNYKISIYKIKSESGEDISIKDKEFTAFDNKVPDIVKIKQLGNKVIKVYFSEPIKPATNSNFKIDGKRFSGSVRTEDHIVYLTFFTSQKEGKYVLTTTNIEDYCGYKAIEKDTPFEIVLDKEPPKLVNARATLEEVVLKFDEDINPDTCSKNNFYWQYGSMKRYPTQVRVCGDEVILDFSNNRLLANVETTIYVDGAEDYSGNKIRNEQTKITPVIDMTTPEVVSIKVSNDGKDITVYYSKSVVGDNKNFYTIKDRNNKIVNIKEVTGSGREYTIKLFTPLPVDTNSLNIQGVYDTTTLKNTIIPYSTTIEMKDLTRPKITSYSGNGRQIMLQFSKKMDIGTLVDPNNYLISLGNYKTYMPKDAEFNPLNDGQTLVILLPEKIDGKDVNVGLRGNLTELQIIRLADPIGNYIEPDVVNLTFDYNTSGKAKVVDFIEYPGYQGLMTESNKIQVRFSEPIVSASPYDFKIYGRTIYDVQTDGTDVVTLLLDDTNDTASPNSLTVNSRNDIKTFIGNEVQYGGITVKDKVSPHLKDDNYNLTIYRNTIELTFSEPLESKVETLFANDLIITSESTRKPLSPSEYETKLKMGNPDTIVITIKTRRADSYSIMLASEPKYIMDKSGNIIESSGQVFYTNTITSY